MGEPPFRRVTVIGAGTMGHGIAQVCALAGCSVVLQDTTSERLAHAVDRIRNHLDRGLEKGRITPADRDAALARIEGRADPAGAAEGADLVVEAVPENLELKREVLRFAGESAPSAVLATNTSSISVAAIASACPDPSRVVGLHFFNPVPVMALLEVVRSEVIDPGILDRVVAFGAAIGKECIVVRDSPGFATSRLGVCLGMEAIRMLQEGVASAEDIDRAMVLGYRHPMGPLRLTDLVGLDVRMAIGNVLMRNLGNPAFEPPELMRRLVAEGKLGQKTGQGFYRW